MLFLPGLCHNIHMKSFQLKSQGRSAGRGEVLIPLSCLRKCDGCALGCWDMQQEVYILWCVELLQAWANHRQEILRNQMEFRSFQFNVCRNFVLQNRKYSQFSTKHFPASSQEITKPPISERIWGKLPTVSSASRFEHVSQNISAQAYRQ